MADINNLPKNKETELSELDKLENILLEFSRLLGMNNEDLDNLVIKLQGNKPCDSCLGEKKSDDYGYINRIKSICSDIRFKISQQQDYISELKKNI